MRMRGLEPPQSYLHTDLNRIEAPWMRPGASDTSKLRPSGDAFDALECSDVVTMLSRLPGRSRMPSSREGGTKHQAMERLAHSKNTPATDASFELLSRIAVDSRRDERYPDRTVLVPADSSASLVLSRAIGERRPIARVFSDGSDVLARPPEARGLLLVICLALIRLADWVGGKHDRSTFVPREWVTEFHTAPARHQPDGPVR